MMPDMLKGERYVVGTAVTQPTLQVGMVSGFALGGIVVAGLGVRAALLADAATFAASAVLVRLWVRQRPAAAPPAAAGPFPPGEEGARGGPAVGAPNPRAPVRRAVLGGRPLVPGGP